MHLYHLMWSPLTSGVLKSIFNPFTSEVIESSKGSCIPSTSQTAIKSLIFTYEKRLITNNFNTFKYTAINFSFKESQSRCCECSYNAGQSYNSVSQWKATAHSQLIIFILCLRALIVELMYMERQRLEGNSFGERCKRKL